MKSKELELLENEYKKYIQLSKALSSILGIASMVFILLIFCLGAGLYDSRERARSQTQLHVKSMEMLHWVYDTHPSVWGELEKTKEWSDYDSYKGHDWENFYLYHKYNSYE